MIEEHLKCKLIKLIEKPVITSLIVNEFVNYNGKELDWKNISISKKGEEALNKLKSKDNTEIINVDKLIEELCEIFPKDQLDSKNSLIQRWNLFLKSTSLEDITHEEVVEAAKNHVNEMGPKYCGNLFYFFFKYNKSIYQSRLENKINLIRDADKNTKLLNPKLNVDWD